MWTIRADTDAFKFHVSKMQCDLLLYYLCELVWLIYTLIQIHNLTHNINTSYLTDSHIAFTVKLESGSKITIFGLKMMREDGYFCYWIWDFAQNS